ncbi:uncharacterized protein LOC111053652 [Nilaparvata lugens]|uniref:uncharacterized protein LOC111053652 n=1 Tax=Nilaparvata lugens TaxID=108931 RepID=UPI00193DE9AB|nr:uncharacterized protein LOC111053652 [Nilaparvata lugens]
MTFHAQVWATVLLATLASVSCRPEQMPNSRPEEPVLALRSGEIQALPEEEAVRNSRAYTREGNDALSTETDEDISSTTDNLNVETERIMTTEIASHIGTEEKFSTSNTGVENTKEAMRTLLNRISRIDHSIEMEDSKQGMQRHHIPRVIQLDNTHLGIEGRTSNKFQEMDNRDEMTQIQADDISKIRGILKISNSDDETKNEGGSILIMPGENNEKSTVDETKMVDDDSTKTSNKIPSIGQMSILMNGQERPTNYADQYNLDNSAMQQLLFNPTLKDIFKYNPAFDYLSKVADSQYSAPNFNTMSKLNYDDSSDSNHKTQEPVIRRKIQYHQMVFQPNPSSSMMNPMFMRQHQGGFPQSSVISYYPGLDYSTIINGNQRFGAVSQTNRPIITDYPQHQQTLQSNVLHIPSMSNLQTSPVNRMQQMRNNVPQRAYDDYFPVIIHNPFNMMWSAFTNIIEYGPEADVCRAAPKVARKGKTIVGASIDQDNIDLNSQLRFEIPKRSETLNIGGKSAMGTSIDEDNIDLNSELRFEIPKRFGGPPPFIRRMKVRRGGVAIAGPGGIATAGSGGTAIVGPGGTAYTKEDGTAIVGPGGRLVHVPEFPPMNFFNQPIGEGRTFQDPPGSKLIAMGPVIYYNPRSATEHGTPTAKNTVYRMQYWMFHTPTRPVMYIPEYNAVLIPAGARGSGRPQNMMLKPAQPPRRRRPLVDLIRYMQGKTSGEVDDEGYMRFATQEVTGMNQKEHDELLDKMRQLVSMGVVDSIQIINRPDNDLENIKEVTNEKESMKISANQEKVKIENKDKTTNSSKDAFVHQNDKQRSNPIHSQLFQRETKYPADHSRGYHFSYKYVIPHNHHNVAQVSVQQRSSPPQRQPFFGTIPTQVPHLHFVPENKQVPLPRVIERKTSVPLQMISLRKEVEHEKEDVKPPKEAQIKPAVTNATQNSTSGITQAIPIVKPITNYHSPRPEIQQAIKFDKIPQKPAAPKPVPREETLERKDEQKDLLQSIGLQQEEKKEEGQQEKRVSVKFDNKNGGVSEIKVNTKVKSSSSVETDLNPKDGIMGSLQDVPLVQVQTHTRKQTVNIMDGGFDKRTADAMKIGFLMGSAQGDKDADMFPVDEEGASPRVYLREAPLPEETSNEMVVVTGKKPSELILSPVARAVAGPRGVAIAAPVAKAYVRGGEEVMLQFDPDSVAIAGPGGRAHSHPRLIVTYMEDKPKMWDADHILRVEHRALQEVRTLEYYGGAKGQYLIIHPSGQMFVSRINIDRKEEEGGEDEDVGMEEGGLEGGSSGGGSDSVTIKPPPDNASIAEAKPVALAIAGVGGVASSRPTATAVVGPGGLAIARPVATSIAGVGGSGSPPIVISPAHGGLQPPPPPPSAGAYLNSIEPHPSFFYNTFEPQPDFHYPHPHPHHVLHPQQPLFVYPYGYLNAPIPQVK